MAIDLYWDNDEQTIMLCEFDKNWTWDEMFSTLETIKQVTAKRDYEIAAIIDLRKGVNIPGGSIFSTDTRDKAKKMLAMGSDGKGPMVVVGGGMFIKTISTAFSMVDSTAMNGVYFTDTLDHARSILAERLSKSQRVLA